MGMGISKSVGAHELEPASLGELIHQHVRAAIETAVHEELRAVLGTTPYERSEVRRGYRNGTKARTLTGPTGQSRSPCREPRCSLARRNGRRRSSPAISGECPRSMKRSSPRTWRGATPAGFAARSNPCSRPRPLSKSAVSRVVATPKDGREAWRTRSLTELGAIYIYLDGFALRMRSAGKVVSVPVLGVVGVLPDGHKQLLALELCGGESFIAWKGCLEDLVERGLRAPVLAIIDGNPGLRRAVGEATNGRATLLRAQAARPRAESPEARPLGDPGRLPSHRLRGQR